MPVPPVAAPLYALPPSRFVAARDALARELAARKDPAAAAVRRLPRPVGLAWVMNRLARERAEDVRALLDAATRLRAGQRRALAGEGAGELRAAEEDVRARARALRGAAGPILEEAGRRADATALARLELLLRVAATSPGGAREALRDGVLEREPPVATPDLSGLAVLAGDPAGAAGAARPVEGGARRASAPAKSAKPVQARDAREASTEARAAREAARAAREDARRAARERARARKGAREQLARAQAEARRAERAARAAQEAARRAEERARTLRARADAVAAEARRRAEALRELDG